MTSIDFHQQNWHRLSQKKLSWELFRIRSQILQRIRDFFNRRGFLEIDAPLLTPYPTLDNNIRSIDLDIRDFNGKSHRLFMHTSPEHAMKKLLAAGAEKIYFLGKVFRDGELTHLHNPEFTMLEWYHTDADYHDIQKDTEELIRFVSDPILSDQTMDYQNSRIDLSLPWECVTVRDLFLKHAAHDLEKSDRVEDLRESASILDISYQIEDDWETLFFRIFLEKIEPHLGYPKPTFVTDYPARLGLMARNKTDQPGWAERVELYIAGIELANGYSELTDPEEQKERFSHEQRKVQAATGKSCPLDEELIEALKMGFPPSAGMSIGVDRLVMLLSNKTHIQDVLLFPMHQWID